MAADDTRLAGPRAARASTSAKLTVIFFIILCVEAGLLLTFLPWVHLTGLIGDWGDNFFLVYLSQKAGLPGIQRLVASGWVRGAVTGLGLLNFLLAFWEIAHFKQTVRALQTHSFARAAAPATENATRPVETTDLPDHERRDIERDEPVEP